MLAVCVVPLRRYGRGAEALVLTIAITFAVVRVECVARCCWLLRSRHGSEHRECP